jgi:hypothetical protein
VREPAKTCNSRVNTRTCESGKPATHCKGAGFPRGGCRFRFLTHGLPVKNPKHPSWGDHLAVETRCAGCEPAFAGHDSPPPLQVGVSVLMWRAWGASKRLRMLDPDAIQTQLMLLNSLPNLSNTQNNSLSSTYCKIPGRGVSKLKLFFTYWLLIRSTYCRFGSKTSISEK